MPIEFKFPVQLPWGRLDALPLVAFRGSTLWAVWGWLLVLNSGHLNLYRFMEDINISQRNIMPYIFTSMLAVVLDNLAAFWKRVKAVSIFIYWDLEWSMGDTLANKGLPFTVEIQSANLTQGLSSYCGCLIIKQNAKYIKNKRSTILWNEVGSLSLSTKKELKTSTVNTRGLLRFENNFSLDWKCPCFLNGKEHCNE